MNQSIKRLLLLQMVIPSRVAAVSFRSLSLPWVSAFEFFEGRDIALGAVCFEVRRQGAEGPFIVIAAKPGDETIDEVMVPLGFSDSVTLTIQQPARANVAPAHDRRGDAGNRVTNMGHANMAFVEVVTGDTTRQSRCRLRAVGQWCIPRNSKASAT